MEKQQFDYFRLSPAIILLWGVFSVAFLPVIPIASGFGWDGVFYGQVTMDFPNMIGHMDSYHSGRIFPGVLLHYVLVLLKMPLTVKSALVSYQVFDIVVLTFSAFMWVKISKHLALPAAVKWFGFVALFINFPVLRFYYYYPSLTDITTFCIGIVMLYAYLKANWVLLFAVSLISFFAWPTEIIIGLILYVYANTGNDFWLKGGHTIRQFLLILLLLSPLLIVILGFANYDSMVYWAVGHGHGGEKYREVIKTEKIQYYNIAAFVCSLIAVGYLIFIYWYILKRFDFWGFVKASLTPKIVSRTLVALVFLLTLIVCKHFLYDPQLRTVTFAMYASVAVELSCRFPAQFLISYIVYWGPVILILLLFFPDVVRFLKRAHFPLLLGLLFTFLFNVNAEGRPITNFYPFIVFILIEAVDFSKIRHWRLFMALFVFASLVFSKIWMPMPLPATTFPTVIMKGLDRFPMQWYFMNFGPWINGQMYLVHSIAALVFGVLFYLIIKEKKL